MVGISSFKRLSRLQALFPLRGQQHRVGARTPAPISRSVAGNEVICDKNGRSWAAKKLFDEKLKIQFMKLRSCPLGKSGSLLKLTGSRTGC